MLYFPLYLYFLFPLGSLVVSIVCMIIVRVIPNLILSLYNVFLSAISGAQKSYRCYSPTPQHYFFSFDVIFMESIPYFLHSDFCPVLPLSWLFCTILMFTPVLLRSSRMAYHLIMHLLWLLLPKYICEDLPVNMSFVASPVTTKTTIESPHFVWASIPSTWRVWQDQKCQWSLSLL